MVTSWFFFKMILLRQFLSELDDILTQCSCICVSICSSWIVDTAFMTSLMTSSPNNRAGLALIWTAALKCFFFGNSCQNWTQFLSELDAILVRIGRHFNTMFPYIVCLYIPHVHFWTKINTFSAASERTMSPTGLFQFQFVVPVIIQDFFMFTASNDQ